LEKTNIFLPIVFKKEYLGDDEQEEMIEDTMEESTKE
jgi:hypothetical protein